MATGKDIAFVRQLLAGTTSGQVQWEATAARNQFATGFKGKYIVSIEKNEESSGTYYSVRVSDSDGHELLTVGSWETEMARELFNAAQRNALNVDAAIDEIMGELGGQENEDPFSNR